MRYWLLQIPHFSLVFLSEMILSHVLLVPPYRRNWIASFVPGIPSRVCVSVEYRKGKLQSYWIRKSAFIHMVMFQIIYLSSLLPICVKIHLALTLSFPLSFISLSAFQLSVSSCLPHALPIYIVITTCSHGLTQSYLSIHSPLSVSLSLFMTSLPPTPLFATSSAF